MRVCWIVVGFALKLHRSLRALPFPRFPATFQLPRPLSTSAASVPNMLGRQPSSATPCAATRRILAGPAKRFASYHRNREDITAYAAPTTRKWQDESASTASDVSSVSYASSLEFQPIEKKPLPCFDSDLQVTLCVEWLGRALFEITLPQPWNLNTVRELKGLLTSEIKAWQSRRPDSGANGVPAFVLVHGGVILADSHTLFDADVELEEGRRASDGSYAVNMRAISIVLEPSTFAPRISPARAAATGTTVHWSSIALVEGDESMGSEPAAPRDVLVRDLTIVSPSFGSVRWLDAVTLPPNCTVDSFVTFERNSVHVSDAAPPGRVEVAVFGVVPDADAHTSLPEFTLLLRQFTASIGATFVDYDGSSGVWRFTACHAVAAVASHTM